MKEVKLLIIGILLTVNVFGQIPVTDVAANSVLIEQSVIQTQELAAALENVALNAEKVASDKEAAMIQAKELAEATSQTKQLKDSYTTLQKTMEVYKKVSNVLIQSERVADLITNQYKFVKECGNTMIAISKMGFSLSEIRNANNKISGLLRKAAYNIRLVNDLLVDYKISTDDGNRIMIIEQIADAQQRLEKELRFYDRLNRKKQQLKKFYAQEYNSYVDPNKTILTR